MRHGLFALSIASLVSLSACAQWAEPGAENLRVDRRASNGAGNYYIVTRPDTRKCMWPICGGVYVKQVNAAQTECLDGTLQADCYVSDMDLTQLGLDQASLDALRTATDGGKALIRGTFQKLMIQSHEVTVLLASEGWLGRAGTEAPAGDFYRVLNNGIVCFTWPCGSLTEETLNTTIAQSIHGIDLAASGADQAALADGTSALNTAGVLVVGVHNTITGPAGNGIELVSAEFYTQVAAANGEPCGQGVCEAGEFCCNPGCGICAPVGGGCIEIACMPCDHGVCETGAALNTGCDQCVKSVCNLDPYCCNTAWDNICVAEATSECNACQNPTPPVTPPAACGHSECQPGAALESNCSTCADTVCAADSFCCDNAWDNLCVQRAENACSQCTPPPSCKHSECQEGAALDATCTPCAGAVCNADPFCCNNAWDHWCAQAAQQLCTTCQ